MLCQILGLLVPKYSQTIEEAYAIDIIEEDMLFCEYYETANIEQRNLIDQVIREVLHHDTRSNVFFFLFVLPLMQVVAKHSL